MDHLERNVAEIVRAWKSGDVGSLEKHLLAGMRDYPEIHQKLIEDRNRRWLPQIEGLLSRGENALIVVGAITNGIFNPANSTAMISMMPREHRGFASAVNHVTFGFGNVLGVALGGLSMSLAFERYTGMKTADLTTENPLGFVAALNTTFVAAICLSIIALFTSALGGSKKTVGLEANKVTR